MKSCSRKILELFYNAKHSGRIMKPDAIGRVGEDDDGLVIELTWRVVDDVIMEAKFRAFGNPNAIAITSLMTDNIIGKNIEEAMKLDESVIINNLDEFRPEYIEAYDMVHAAMVEAYNNYLKRKSRKDESAGFEYEIEPVMDESSRPVLIVDSKQTELKLTTASSTEKRGRGRPRKIVDESAIVEVGEKRGRGRPRKVVDETEQQPVGEKRGRGRPRKIVDESTIVEVGEKRGRGRPRKIVDESEIVVTEKRGRGRPRKIVDENAIVEVGEKRGRGRPRKIVDETAQQPVGEKRGRGRPRKIVDESQIVVTEKRGRGRPRKIDVVIGTLDDNVNTFVEEEKQEAKFSLPTDLNDRAEDSIESLIAGTTQQVETDNFVNNLISNKLLDEDDETFDADYDLFKSNIRNIFSGKETSSTPYGESKTIKTRVVEDVVSEKADETSDEIVIENNTDEDNSATTIIADEKRGRGRPRKVVEEVEVDNTEKRGRGRPRKIVETITEEVETEKRGRGRPRVDAVSSLTRSLNTPGGVPTQHNTQDIVFASKNVTTTNININVTKTTTSVDDAETISDYAKNVNVTSTQQNSVLTTPVSALGSKSSVDDEIEVESSKPSNIKFKDIDDDFDDDFDEEFHDLEDDSDIKDEAPKSGIEDLLKALLNND